MAEKIKSYKVSGSQNSIRHLRDRGLDAGHVHTAFGTVIVEQYEGDDGEAWLYLSMAHRGRIYNAGPVGRRAPTSDRGLAIIAGRFAGDVAAIAARPAKK